MTCRGGKFATHRVQQQAGTVSEDKAMPETDSATHRARNRRIVACLCLGAVALFAAYVAGGTMLGLGYTRENPDTIVADVAYAVFGVGLPIGVYFRRRRGDRLGAILAAETTVLLAATLYFVIAAAILVD